MRSVVVALGQAWVRQALLALTVAHWLLLMAAWVMLVPVRQVLVPGTVHIR
jgi:hypothetical protein